MIITIISLLIKFCGEVSQIPRSDLDKRLKGENENARITLDATSHQSHIRWIRECAYNELMQITPEFL